MSDIMLIAARSADSSDPSLSNTDRNAIMSIATRSADLVSCALWSESQKFELGYKKLTLVDLKARGLVRRDFLGLSDPYVTITIRGEGGSDFQPTEDMWYQWAFKTVTMKNTLNPDWSTQPDNYKRYWISGKAGFIVILDVYNENRVFKDNFLGRAVLYFDLTGQGEAPRMITPLKGKLGIIDRENHLREKGKLCTLTLHDKYAEELVDRSYSHMACVQELEEEFRTGREQESRRKHYHHPNRGELVVKYVLECDWQYHAPQPGQLS